MACTVCGYGGNGHRITCPTLPNPFVVPALEDSGYARTPRNTPAASRGQAAPANEADKAKRTDKTGGRGTDFKIDLVDEDGNVVPVQRAKPRKRTEGSIVVPELPWKRGGAGG